MAASLVSIPEYVRERAAGRISGQWTNQERAELTRVVNLLGQAGLPVETDSGLTDEGDPWMVFVRPDTGDVIAHFARIDGRFVAAGTNAGVVVEGDSFRDVVDKILARQPLLMSGTGPMTSFGGRHAGSAERVTGTGDRAAPRATDSGDNVTTLFTHPSVVLAAFVATALMQARKAGETAGPSPSAAGAGKAPLDGRTSPVGSAAPGSRGQLQDSLTALSTGDGAGTSTSSGQTGFMLHSAGMASAMAMVVAAMTPASGNLDGSSTSVLGTLARVGRTEDGTADGSGNVDAARTADASVDPARDGGHPASAQQPADGLDQPNRGGEGDAGPVILAGSVGGVPGASSHDGAVALAATEVVVDADLFFADLLGAASDLAPAAQPGSARAPTDGTTSATESNSAALAGGQTASDGTGSPASDTAPKARAAADSDGDSGTGSAGDPTASDAAGHTDAASKTEVREASGEFGSQSGDLVFGSIIWVGTVTPGGNDFVDVSEMEDDTYTSGTVNDDTLLADTADKADEDSSLEVEPSLPVVIYSRLAEPTHEPDADKATDGKPGTDDAPVSPGQEIVFSGGLMEVESFNPIRDTLAVTGEPAELGFYQVIYTYDGIEFRFDTENVISLLGVAPEDLGYG
ncbi:hypothetical protein [uncultured Rhodospira sp.]|uniref:hypothetical protein n=1 Tax=uncultured Rhodospira sp. TaxID=1936189 RepID=UPI002617F257|nr:hypothetical protein [uncultured Rhodospira sp.]